MALDASEAVFLRSVQDAAKAAEWLVFHPVPAQVRPGLWRSDGKGFPDLVMAHPKRGVIFAELKTATGRMTPDQKTWAACLAPHVEYHLWTPKDMANIVKRLWHTPTR